MCIIHSFDPLPLFPWLEERLDPLTEKERQFVQVVSLTDLPGHMVQYHWKGKGRMSKDRTGIAKAVYNFGTTDIFDRVPSRL